MEVGAEMAWIVEPAFPNGLPGFPIQNFGAELELPDNLYLLTLCIIIETSQFDERTAYAGFGVNAFY